MRLETGLKGIDTEQSMFTHDGERTALSGIGDEKVKEAVLS